MDNYTLEIHLLNDTAFSMGAGISGVVDAEIQHDALGLPTVSGRAIKGLLVDVCSEILYALPANTKAKWEKAANRLFGSRGDTEEESILYIGDAGIAPDLAAFIASENSLSKQELLEALTDIRRQTAMNELGASEDETLRAVRVLIKGISLYAPLAFNKSPSEDEKALLAACILGIRRAGLGRMRGKGELEMKLTNQPLEPERFATVQKVEDQSSTWFLDFKKAVLA